MKKFLPKNVRFVENLHVFFWLVKDYCWTIEFKTLGVLMVIPTVSIAIYICIQSLKKTEIWINLAVLCWIVANSTWMILEFANLDHHKYWVTGPFVLGLIFCVIYLIVYYKESKTEKLVS